MPKPKPPARLTGESSALSVLGNTQTIGSLFLNGRGFVGTCRAAHDIELVRVDMPALIARLGVNTTVPEAMKQIACPRCGAPVAVHVDSINRTWGAGSS